jgi:hypothetical protein
MKHLLQRDTLIHFQTSRNAHPNSIYNISLSTHLTVLSVNCIPPIESLRGSIVFFEVSHDRTSCN